MKKLFKILLSFVLMVCAIYAFKIEVTKTTIIRSQVSAKDNVGIARVGDQFEVLEEIGAWHFIEIVSDSEHIGKQGWIYCKLIDGKSILGDGAILHTQPITSSDEVCRVKGGAKYKLVKIDVKWYKIGEGKYIYYYNTKKIQ